MKNLQRTGCFLYYVVMGIIILTILAFLKSCYNQYSLSSYVKEIATADVEEHGERNDVITTPCHNCNQVDRNHAEASMQIEVLADTTVAYNISLCKETNTSSKEKKHIENNPYNNNNNEQNKAKYLLDILSKSNRLADANNLVFFFTFIVAVLSIFFGYKTLELNKAEQALKDIEISKNDIEQALNNIKEVTNKTKNDNIKTKNLFSHFTRYNNVLTRFASVYNLGIILGNVVMSLSTEKTEEENRIISTKVGELCSRLSLTCNEINTRFYDQKQKLDYLTIDEKEILYTYLTDALGELERSRDSVEKKETKALSNLIGNCIFIVEDIKEKLDCIELKNEVV